MRMWMVNPKWMCHHHLLGEHRELHAIAGMLLKETSIQGYIDNNLIEVQSIIKRHETLVKEMTVRGYKHLSPMINSELVFEHLSPAQFEFKIDHTKSAQDLYLRCQTCAWMCYLYSGIELDMLDAYYHDDHTMYMNENGIYGLRR